MGLEANISGRIKKAAGSLLGRGDRKAAHDLELQLYEEARRLGIKGRAQMSKDELAAEIAARK